MENKSVIILKGYDWQACYVHGVSIMQNHHLGEGMGLVWFLQENAKVFGFDIFDIKEVQAKDVDIEACENVGEFPAELDELEGEYDFT